MDRDELLEEIARIAERRESSERAATAAGLEDETFRSDEAAKIRALKDERAELGSSPEVLKLDAPTAGPGRPGPIPNRDYYHIVFTANLQPRPGWIFDRLTCRLEFEGDTGDDKVGIHDLFPATEWRDLARVDAQLEVGIDAARLEFRTKAAPVLVEGLDSELRARVDAGASFLFPARSYRIRKALVESAGRNSRAADWRIDEAGYRDGDEPQFAVILRTSVERPPGRVIGLLKAERSFNYWGSRLGDLIRDLPQAILDVLRGGTAIEHRIECPLNP
jgi:hypothetical protein